MKSISLITLALTCGLSTAANAQQYTIEDLGSISATPTDSMRAVGINNRGHVLADGDRTHPSGTGVHFRAFFWEDGVHTIITLPGGFPTWAGNLNDADVCTGHYLDLNTSNMLGFLWDNGQLSSVLRGTNRLTKLWDINRYRATAGEFASSLLIRNHGLWNSPGLRWRELHPLGTDWDSTGSGINDYSEVVGSSFDSAREPQAFRWSSANGVVALPDLGVPWSKALDINNFHQVAGSARNDSSHEQPVLWLNGMPQAQTTLGLPKGRANAINDHGVAVGGIRDGVSIQLACLWEGGVGLDLNTAIAPGSGWVLGSAKDINELGEICGNGTFNGLPRAYKLTPILQKPRLSGFRPGFAGETNTQYGIGFAPGATVYFFGSLTTGSTLVPCGTWMGLGSPHAIATVTADAQGRIEVDVDLPAFLAGRTVYLQAVENGCAVSELRLQHLQ